jgi:hypothetical protein
MSGTGPAFSANPARLRLQVRMTTIHNGRLTLLDRNFDMKNSAGHANPMKGGKIVLLSNDIKDFRQNRLVRIK